MIQQSNNQYVEKCTENGQEIIVQFKQNCLNLIKYQGIITEIKDYFISGDGIMTKQTQNMQQIQIKSNFISSKPNGLSEIKYPDGTQIICNFYGSYDLQGEVKIIKNQNYQQLIQYDNNKPIKILQIQDQNKLYQFQQYDQYNQPIYGVIQTFDGSYYYEGQINGNLQPNGRGKLKEGSHIYQDAQFINGKVNGKVKVGFVDSSDYQINIYDKGQIQSIIEKVTKNEVRKILYQDEKQRKGIIESKTFKYEGEMDKNLQMFGKGQFIIKGKSDIFIGQFKNDQFNGLINRYTQVTINGIQKQIQLSIAIYQNGQCIQRKLQNIFNKQNILTKQIIFNSGNENDGYQISIVKYDANEMIQYQQHCSCYINEQKQVVIFGKYSIDYFNGDKEFGIINKHEKNIKEKEIQQRGRLINIYQGQQLIKQYDQLMQKLTQYSQEHENQIIYQYYGQINQQYEPQGNNGLIIIYNQNKFIYQYGKFKDGQLLEQYDQVKLPILNDKQELFTIKIKDNGIVNCQFYNYQKYHILPISIQTNNQTIYFQQTINQNFIKQFIESDNKQQIITQLKFQGQIIQKDKIVYNGIMNYVGQPLDLLK